MMKNTDISQIRRDYSLTGLDEAEVDRNPFIQFSRWMEDAIKSGTVDPSAMILATADKNAVPSVRVVLLKAQDEEGFVFFTNYESRKGKDINENPSASLLFFWKELERQIRVSGEVRMISRKDSGEYFHSRPYESQLAAWASAQSSVIPGRDYLMKEYENLKLKYSGAEIPLPPFWGGFKLIPAVFEFWQGRENRLHDRICYQKENGAWRIFRVAP